MIKIKFCNTILISHKYFLLEAILFKAWSDSKYAHFLIEIQIVIRHIKD